MIDRLKEKGITFTDIAMKSGYSKTTAWLVFHKNRNSKRVSEETRKEVLEAANILLEAK